MLPAVENRSDDPVLEQQLHAVSLPSCADWPEFLLMA